MNDKSAIVFFSIKTHTLLLDMKEDFLLFISYLHMIQFRSDGTYRDSGDQSPDTFVRTLTQFQSNDEK